MSATPPQPVVTGDELIQHRLKQLEEWRVESAATVRSTERDVDALKIESATVKGLLIELRTEVRDNDQHIRSSLARLHERVDTITTAEARDEGREDGEKAAMVRIGKVAVATLTLALMFAGVVIALIELVIKHH